MFTEEEMSAYSELVEMAFDGMTLGDGKISYVCVSDGTWVDEDLTDEDWEDCYTDETGGEHLYKR